MKADNDDATFSDALEGLHRGDFSRLEPHFDDRSGKAQIVEWHEQGRLLDQPKALAEALTCASFLGRTSVVEYLLKQGLDPSGGAGTGLEGLHSKHEACMAAQHSERPSGRLSTNRDTTICKSSKSCLMRVPVWTIRNI